MNQTEIDILRDAEDFFEKPDPIRENLFETFLKFYASDDVESYPEFKLDFDEIYEYITNDRPAQINEFIEEELFFQNQGGNISNVMTILNQVKGNERAILGLILNYRKLIAPYV